MKKYVIKEIVRIKHEIATGNFDMSNYDISFTLYLVKAIGLYNVTSRSVTLEETAAHCRSILLIPDFEKWERRYEISAPYSRVEIINNQCLDNEKLLASTISQLDDENFASFKVVLANFAINHINKTFNKTIRTTTNWTWRKAI